MTPSARVVASWQRDAVHVWGWDGVQTMPPFWLVGGFPSRAAWARRRTTGSTRRSTSSRRRASGCARCRSVSTPSPASTGCAPSAVASDSVRWFGALAALAERVVAAGAVRPVFDTPTEPSPDEVPGRRRRGALGADDGPAVETHLDNLAAAMPPICLPDVARDDIVRRRRRRRRRSTSGSSTTPPAPACSGPAGSPIVPRGRSATTAVVRSDVPRPHRSGPRVQTTPCRPRRRPRPGRRASSAASAHRARGEPVLIRRLRLVVPDDRLDPWRVDLELVDEDDPGRWCSAADVWAGNPLAVEVAGGPHQLVRARVDRGRAGRTVAAERRRARTRSPNVDRPAAVELDVEDADEFLEQAPAALERLGIELIGPEHLVRATVAVRGRAPPSPASDRTGRLQPGNDRAVDVHRRRRRRPVGDLGSRAGPRRADRGVAAARRPPLGAHRPGRAAQGPRPARRLPATDRASSPPPVPTDGTNPLALLQTRRRRRRGRRRPRTRRRRSTSTTADGQLGIGGVVRTAARRPARHDAARGDRTRARSPASCGRTSAAASAGCDSSSASASAAASPTTWASARRRRRSPTSSTDRARTSSSARSRSSTTGRPRPAASRRR